MTVCAIVIAKDNSAIIEEMVLNCRSVIEPDVFIMDEGSSDDTVVRAMGAGAMVLEFEGSRESTTIQAIRQVSSLDYTQAVVIKASEATKDFPLHIPRFLDMAFDYPGVICVATTGNKERKGFNGRLAELCGWRRFEDVWSGFRMYPIEETLALCCRESGENFEPEALVRASWAGVPTMHIKIGQEWRTSDSHGTTTLGFGIKIFLGMLMRSPRLLWRRVAYGG